MKIAIIGGTGLLGSNLVKLYYEYDVRSFSRGHSANVSKINNNILNFDCLDNELSQYFDAWKPNIIINAIALVSLQKCEDDYEAANDINCNIAVQISKIAQKYIERPITFSGKKIDLRYVVILKSLMPL